MSVYCRYMFVEVGLVSGLVRQCRVCVGMFSARPSYIPDLFGKVGLLSVRVRRGRLSAGTCLASGFIVGTCPAKSA